MNVKELARNIAEDLSDEVHVLPYGPVTGRNADDHVHFDLGFMTLIPRVRSRSTAARTGSRARRSTSATPPRR